jgi:hypothetical protein
MWSFNPAVYLRRAWDKTNSGWGKASLVLFYLFVWLSIIKSIWGVIDPTYMGKASCYTEGMSEFNASLVTALIRGISLFAAAFFIYADKGGLHSWNVGFVAFFVIVYFWIAKASVLEEIHNECMGSMAKFMWITPLWVVVAFIAVVIDERMGESGTEGERQPINV